MCVLNHIFMFYTLIRHFNNITFVFSQINWLTDCLWLIDWLIDWLSVSEWMSEWVSEWVSDARRQTVLIMLRCDAIAALQNIRDVISPKTLCWEIDDGTRSWQKNSTHCGWYGISHCIKLTVCVFIGWYQCFVGQLTRFSWYSLEHAIVR